MYFNILALGCLALLSISAAHADEIPEGAPWMDPHTVMYTSASDSDHVASCHNKDELRATSPWLRTLTQEIERAFTQESSAINSAELLQEHSIITYRLMVSEIGKISSIKVMKSSTVPQLSTAWISHAIQQAAPFQAPPNKLPTTYGIDLDVEISSGGFHTSACIHRPAGFLGRADSGSGNP